ncbi:MAG TPA: hypothetical protein VJZ77_18280 [Blastocatellia bacterium]|nr:hypothetical protein [Blastocatellia bacterium]
MRRKKQFLMVALCAFSMVVNSAAVVAQSKDKKQEPKSDTQQAPEPPSDRLILTPPSTFHMAVPAQDFAYAAPQVQFIHNEFSFDGGLVKGAPYSADAVTETIQTLGDGNRIVQSSSAKIYRDSAGRTRREQTFKAIGPWAVSGEPPVTISINDPVAGVTYSLNSNMKTAHKMAMPRPVDAGRLEKMRAELKEKMDKLKAANGAEAGVSGANEVVIKEGASVAYSSVARSGIATGAAGGAVIRGVRPGMPMPVGGGVFSWTSDAEVNQEQLGAQSIEGVAAEGTRVTFTIPAGKIGNERPIVTVNERWYSQELQAVVLSKNSDPRMGETTYRLTNIDRSEPDPSLFQVPTDYTVEEGGFNRNFFFSEPSKVEIQKKRRPNEN